MSLDPELLYIVGGVISLLLLSSIITAILKRKAGPQGSPTLDNLLRRVNAWWIMVAIFRA